MTPKECLEKAEHHRRRAAEIEETVRKHHEGHEATASGRNKALVHGILAHIHHELYGHLLHESHKYKHEVEKSKGTPGYHHNKARLEQLVSATEKHRLAGESHYKQARAASPSEEHFKATMARAERHHRSTYRNSKGEPHGPKSQAYIVSMAREGFKA